MSNLYTSPSKYNAYKLSQQKQFPSLVCCKNLFPPKSKSETEGNEEENPLPLIHEGTSVKIYKVKLLNETLYHVLFLTYNGMLFLTEQEIEEYFDTEPLKELNLKVSDAPYEKSNFDFSHAKLTES